MDNGIDLIGDDIELETLADGSALGCFASASSASTASCPLTSASSVTTASSYG
ncbi:thiocillin family RiPP [Actinomyces qiguomingii]|uniref:thiocillin family RiPP n=1 Tax=Actinomyces qiguomingii TaxID=2057800 RepID=UPI000CA0829C|nr:thiocillin family RiPP [Actinomyces qiguomingii]